jgi:hypothetical protein
MITMIKVSVKCSKYLDVAVLQTLEQAQRRKEIYSALTSNMEEIFR